LIIGVGIVEKRERQLPYDLFKNAQTKTYCSWQISQNARSIRMLTTQAYKKWALDLEREILLDHRVITITTRLQNTGSTPLPFRWFAHPFFLLNADWQCCRFLMPAQLPENPAFFTNANGFVEMRDHHNWPEGYFQVLEGCEGEKFSAIQLHARLGQMQVRGDFPLSKVAIWANDRTFSFEPFGRFLPRLAASYGFWLCQME
jgi:galactose mutarotase-like enzyme